MFRVSRLHNISSYRPGAPAPRRDAYFANCYTVQGNLANVTLYIENQKLEFYFDRKEAEDIAELFNRVLGSMLSKEAETRQVGG